MAKKKSQSDVTRVLFVSGDDYAATQVEDDIGIKEAVRMVEAGETFPDGIEVEIKKFKGKIDPDFVQFMFDEMIDYDFAKTNCFYVLD